MKKSTSLNLSKLQICPTGSILNPETEFSIKRTAQRHTFLIDAGVEQMAVNMTFTKEKRHDDVNETGCRQLISVKIFDANDGIIVSETEFYAYLPKGVNQKTYTKALEFNYFEICSTPHLALIVVNESENRQIGSYEFQIVDAHEIGGRLTNQITPTCARCISVDKDGKSDYYLSFNPQTNPFSWIRFWGRTNLDTSEDNSMNEFEIKIHYPDGRIESCIKAPEFFSDYFDEFPETPNMIMISEFFCFCEEGIYYAELSILGEPISGFMFRVSEGTNTTGEWKDYNDNLNPIIQYSPEIGEKTFLHAFDKIYQSQKEREEKEAESAPTYKQLDIDWDDEQFDKLLDDFIKAEEENSQKNTQEEEEEEDEFEKLNNEFSDFLDEAVKNIPENDDDEDNDWEFAKDENLNEDEYSEESHDTSSKENCWENLNNLTGLQSVKDKLHAYQNLVNFTKLRTQNHLTPIKVPLHAMFLGAPGTGKTTIAKAMGQMLHNMGILSRGHVVIKERSTLIGKHYSDEETNTLNALEEAQGGILFIDEAYQLYSEHDPRDPGRLVIETLMTKLADESNRDWMLILAGYPEEMMKLYSINPGLASRIPSSNIYTFEDYSENELMEIAENYLSQNQYSLSDEAREALLNRLKADYSSRDKSFGNARHVINLIQLEILPRIATRISANTNPSIDDLTTILASDIPEPIKKELTTRRKIGFC